MISAKSAREQTDGNQIKIGLANIEKKIKKAVADGKNECFCVGSMAQIMVDALQEADYTVEKQANGTKISW